MDSVQVVALLREAEEREEARQRGDKTKTNVRAYLLGAAVGLVIAVVWLAVW